MEASNLLERGVHGAMQATFELELRESIMEGRTGTDHGELSRLVEAEPHMLSQTMGCLLDSPIRSGTVFALRNRR